MECVEIGCKAAATRQRRCKPHYRKALASGEIQVKERKGLSLAERFEQHVDRTTTPDGCHTWTARPNKQGYGQFAVDRGGERYRTELAHRVAFELAYGHPPVGLVCHTCDNPPCVRVEHLYDGTHWTNAQDREQRGRSNRPAAGAPAARLGKRKGETHPLAKLTEQHVAEIRALYATGKFAQTELGAIYGVHQTKISRVVRHEGWRHVG